MSRICRRSWTWGHKLAGACLVLGASATLISGCGRTPLNSSVTDGAAPGTQDETGIPGADSSGEMASCLIASVHYLEGASNPKNSCQSCQPSHSTTDWSDLGAGPGCLGLGDSHSCAVVNGSAWCWGDNSQSELGNSSSASSTIAVPVHGLSSGVQMIAGGGFATWAIVNGGLEAWGSGYLGNNSLADSSIPVQVQGLSSGVQAVAAGLDHACALSGGQVWCWGVGNWGQLGTPDQQSLVPVRVQGLASGVQAIAAQGSYTCALVADSVWCWGHNSYDQVGYFAPAPPMGKDPTKIDGLPSGLQAIAAGDVRTCVLASGSVYCWGQNGPKSFSNPSVSLVPWMISGLPSAVRAIAAGGDYVCALLDDGLMCWGSNWNMGSVLPARIEGLPSPVQAVAMGSNHACALAAGSVWCWGSNGDGQLGNDSTSDSSVPVLVQGLPGS